MTAPGAMTDSIFTVIVKEGKEEPWRGQEEKMSGGAAVKYTKSASSLGSRDSRGEAQILGSRGSQGEAKIVEVQPTENAAGQEDMVLSRVVVTNTESATTLDSVVSERAAETAEAQEAQNAVEIMAESGETKNVVEESKEEKRPPQVKKEEKASKISGKKSSTKKLSKRGTHDSVSAEGGTTHMNKTRGSGTDSTAVKKDRKFKHQKHTLWYRLRHRITHMGVVEVDSRHPFCYRLKALSAGVCAVLSDPQNSGPCVS